MDYESVNISEVCLIWFGKGIGEWLLLNFAEDWGREVLNCVFVSMQENERNISDKDHWEIQIIENWEIYACVRIHLL